MKRHHVLLCLLALVPTCAGPAPVPILSPSKRLDALAEPRPPSPEVTPGLPDGPDRSINAGQCKGLPAGHWVSERKFQLRILATEERNRLRKEFDAVRQLALEERANAVEFEHACRRRAIDADKRAELRLWLGIGIGAASVLAGGWAIGQAR